MTTKFEYVDDLFVGSNGLFADTWMAATFTPSVPHAITSVKLLLWRVGTPASVQVSIRATDGGLPSSAPTGADLCSGVTNGDTLTTDTAGEWREITFPIPAALKADRSYAIVVRAPSGSDPLNVIWWRRSNTGYAGGGRWDSLDAGVTWPIGQSADMGFEDWGAPQQGGMFAFFP